MKWTVYNAIQSSSSAMNTPFVKPTVSSLSWDCVKQMLFPVCWNLKQVLYRVGPFSFLFLNCVNHKLFITCPKKCHVHWRCSCCWSETRAHKLKKGNITQERRVGHRQPVAGVEVNWSEPCVVAPCEVACLRNVSEHSLRTLCDEEITLQFAGRPNLLTSGVPTENCENFPHWLHTCND